ncbi:MAG TPA: chemotaxis protein CheW, partial [Polyangiaceae bacterium]|nr:chemotaxis protein CheW [Polyangiaceae bacterium]
NSTPGAGTSFKLILPLTLAIIEGMLVACGKERYIIPSLMIVESVQPTSEMVRTPSRDTEVINVRGELMPLLRLARLFDIPESEQDPANARVVVVESAGSKLGLMVDDVLTQQQVVIKPLSAGLGDTDFLAGAAILSDGRVGLILNVERLSSVFGARRRSTSESREFAA